MEPGKPIEGEIVSEIPADAVPVQGQEYWADEPQTHSHYMRHASPFGRYATRQELLQRLTDEQINDLENREYEEALKGFGIRTTPVKRKHLGSFAGMDVYSDPGIPEGEIRVTNSVGWQQTFTVENLPDDLREQVRASMEGIGQQIAQGLAQGMAQLILGSLQGAQSVHDIDEPAPKITDITEAYRKRNLRLLPLPESAPDEEA